MIQSKCVRKCDGLPPLTADCSVQDTVSAMASMRSAMAAMRSAVMASPTPVPYTFRVSVPAPRKGGCGVAQHAKAPPFYMQLDHTLAVLWCLFRKKANRTAGEDCEVGVGQLQWALYFLKGIKPPNGGDRAEDVSIAIQVVQDALLDLYADMSSVVLQPPAAMSASAVPLCSRCDAVRTSYTGHLQWLPEARVSSCNKCSSLTLGTHKGGGRPRKSSKTEAGLDASKTTLSSKEASCQRTEQVPKNGTLSQEIIELKTMAAELTKKSPEGWDKAEMNIMEEWRKDQIIRVQNELRRLKSLEQTMGVKTDDDKLSMLVNQSAEPGSSFNPGCTSTPNDK